MRAAPVDSRPHLDWITRMYGDFFSRGEAGHIQSALQGLRRGSLNGAPSRSAAEMLEHLDGLRLAVGGGAISLDRISFELDTPIAPETFANIASAWWILPAIASVHRGVVHGASQIIFTDHHEILELRELWSVAVPTSRIRPR
jgi:hypothetical protein